MDLILRVLSRFLELFRIMLPPRPEPRTNLEPNETEQLIIRYRELVSEIKMLRGKLYTRGIDPEKYIN